MRRWWIEEARVLASSNPSDEHLAQLRIEGFGLAVSLLAENKQRQSYDGKLAASAGWGIYRIPVEPGGTPSLVQACEFAALIGATSQATKSLVFCDKGLGGSAFMGAVFWIAKGLTVSAATARVASSAGADPGWKTQGWDEALRKFEQLGWRM